MKKLPTAERGTSLLEVLITIAIMAIGLLGLARLQVSSLRNIQNTLYRAEATLLAHDILDSMRIVNTASHDQAAHYTVAVGSTTAAGPSQMAIDDISAWKTRIAQALPGGDGSVSVSGRMATIRIEWSDRRPGTPDSADSCSTDKTARPACFETQGGV
jgi:type IV pilus assembly protein PilV